MICSKYSRHIVFLFTCSSMLLFGQRGQEIPVRNWAVPDRSQTSQAATDATAKAGPQLQFSSNAYSADALTFVAITPCRLVDTRGAAGGFNGNAPFSGPAIAAGATLSIPVQNAMEASTNTTPAPCGTIPSIAQAYSFNVTVVPASAGAVNYVTLWAQGTTQPVVSTINDVEATVVANAAIVPVGSPSGGISIYNAGPATTNVIIDMNGYFTAPTDQSNNTALGMGALEFNSSGTFNTATGYNALMSNGNGFSNTADGYIALQNNVSGNYNTALGAAALFANTVGTGNIAVGALAAYNVANGNSNNIHIGNQGSSGDSAVIRIGTPGTQVTFFVAGVNGVTTGANNAVPVLVDSNGQLGTVNSSRRFKEDIQDMGDASSGLLHLRPVTFRYKQPFNDGSKPMEYGLIAEEVGEVYPDLVAHSADGQVQSVKYQVLDSMLLNELQKQHAQVADLNGKLDQQTLEAVKQNARAQQQDETIRQLQERLAALEALIEKLPNTSAGAH
ncbi:MAG: tail fiber domain-containing protein [Bryobacterales bacterium]|nr:tail fiber domain-containing protein [Bryobacterales bacterium]